MAPALDDCPGRLPCITGCHSITEVRLFRQLRMEFIADYQTGYHRGRHRKGRILRRAVRESFMIVNWSAHQHPHREVFVMSQPPYRSFPWVGSLTADVNLSYYSGWPHPQYPYCASVSLERSGYWLWGVPRSDNSLILFWTHEGCYPSVLVLGPFEVSTPVSSRGGPASRIELTDSRSREHRCCRDYGLDEPSSWVCAGLYSFFLGRKSQVLLHGIYSR